MNYRSYISSSRVNLSSTLPDGKDLLITKLKEEVQELQHNARDFGELSRQLKDLEMRYDALSQEKMRQEQELRQMQEVERSRNQSLRMQLDSVSQHDQQKNRQLDQ